MTKPADEFDQMERLAAGLLSFKHMSPEAKARFHTDLRNCCSFPFQAARSCRNDGCVRYGSIGTSASGRVKSPKHKPSSQRWLHKQVTARGGLSEDGRHFDKAIAADVLSELVERRLRGSSSN